jgi:hypothetical protein
MNEENTDFVNDMYCCCGCFPKRLHNISYRIQYEVEWVLPRPLLQRYIDPLSKMVVFSQTISKTSGESKEHNNCTLSSAFIYNKSSSYKKDNQHASPLELSSFHIGSCADSESMPQSNH